MDHAKTKFISLWHLCSAWAQACMTGPCKNVCIVSKNLRAQSSIMNRGYNSCLEFHPYANRINI